MLKHLLLLIAATILLPASAGAQSFASQVVDTNNPPPPLANDYGPQPYVDDGLNLANFVSAVPTHQDNDGAPDNVGAFRFICMAGQSLTDDPVVYPGQPHKSHDHQFYGNLGTNAFSTYSSQRTSGDSTCVNKENRSGYWMPGMVRQDGKEVRPDYLVVYYKRYPKGSAQCTPGNALFVGRCVAIPNGLRMISGYDMLSGTNPTGDVEWKCVYNSGQDAGLYKTITAALQSCTQLPGTIGDGKHQLFATTDFQQCWDGQNLDSPNHRSHTADSLVDTGNTNREACDKAHPYFMPRFSFKAVWTLDSTAVTNGTDSWYLSSDRMPGMAPKTPGTTLHVDYFEAWDNAAKKTWTDNCIDRLLNCSAGDLGNGTALTTDPNYPLTYVASPRIITRPKMAVEGVTITVKAPQ